ncbi:MAG TPA: hypothetical protein VJU87_07965 [Gemmatimonadaceae bacterium]|nr:hypothetical protein [Gemmatimonadaceae bacterium]
MAVREFTDGCGRQWRAWDVAPDELNPRTKDEDYLAQLYYTGWIVFETKAGDEKRRLYPIPQRWSELPDAEIEVLLQKAEVVPPRKLRTEKRATGAEAAKEVERATALAEQRVDEPARARASGREETPDVTDLRVVRSFRYPRGRIWAASVFQHPDGGGPAVLRFTAGTRDIDLVDWPKDWVDYPVEGLVNLLRRAAPRPRSEAPPADTPQRRWDDQPPA